MNNKNNTNTQIKSADDGRFYVSGEITALSIPELLRDATVLFNQDIKALYIDLANVTRSDSAGVALLLEWMRLGQRRDLEVHFFNLPEQMKAIAEVTGLSDILPIEA